MRLDRALLRSLVPWVAAALGAALVLGAAVDPRALAFSGRERIVAVFLLDGQSYFGHIEDFPWSDTVTLRSVYYFQDARQSNPTQPLAVVQRGTEAHAPDDGMRIRRDKILAVEMMRLDSPVARAIGTQRAIERAQAGR